MTLDHKHILVTAHIAKPPVSEEAIKDWMRRLVAAVDMKIVVGPFAHYVTTEGNEGLTAVVCIETSHASMHVWSEAKVPFLKFDLYSCKSFEVDTVLDLLGEFAPTYMEWMLLDRNNRITVVSKGIEVPA